MYRIRELVQEDKDAYVKLKGEVAVESGQLMIEPSELDFFKERLNSQYSIGIKKPNFILGAFAADNELVGFLDLTRFPIQRKQHVGYLVMGVSGSHKRQGIGRSLLSNLKSMSKKIGIERLELGVIDGNSPAIELYRSFGFVVEGIKKNGLKISGQYRDEIQMAYLTFI